MSMTGMTSLSLMTGLSVLPPPPRYPTQAAYNAALGAGHIPPMIETNNVLSSPEDQFLVGEGTYVLKEDLHLATPPPHPSEAPILNPNPLATNPQPATAGTRISLLNIDARPAPFQFRGMSVTSLGHASIQEHPHEDTSRDPTLSGSEGRANSSDAPVSLGSAPAFGEGTALLAGQNPKDSSKRKKPKNNMTKSNSSFISRVIVHETLSKRIQERAADGLYVFANINRAFQWLDLSAPNKADYMTKVLFTKAHCLCHDVNQVTKSANHIDVIMGFSTGEVIWWEATSQRYARLNKNGVINGTPVAQIKWIPGSENLFLAAHMDGSLVVYDKEREDAVFSPEQEGKDDGEAEATNLTNGAGPSKNGIQVQKSVNSKHQKFNPVAAWKLSNQRINAFAFSPDNRHLAVVSEDGSLRIIDYLQEQLLDHFRSYYGGLTCVCWSPDGKYVLTGGQDDLISIWHVPESTLIARCQGHHSWVTSVAFDPWRCDDRNYRFGSVGEDCRLCLWDFSVGMLHRPRGGVGAGAASVRQRGSVASKFTVSQLTRAETQGTTASRLRSNSAGSGGGAGGLTGPHPVEPRANTAILPPVLTKVVDADPLCWLEFTQEAIMTSCKSGHIRTWNRPSEPTAQVAETSASR
ncbi:hypothetical protein VPNG_04454 [Cytospora leucostoma]|uniref:Uncharacterized protein n=1 Tax=Cytospora leucostoma TaxID=1230097 RepID=A0A423XC23_9PEZI|nr:hypothetical protein VPNG_04454 [Cytospora leucostoma]